MDSRSVNLPNGGNPGKGIRETLALRKFEEMLFAEPSETAEIIADESLTARLKEGSAQARRGKGRFVE